MVKLPIMNLKPTTQDLKISAQNLSVLTLGHEVCDIRCITSKTKFGAYHWWLYLKSRTKTYWFWVHACIDYAWYVFSHLLSVTYEHWAKEDTEAHQLQSAIMGSRDFWAFELYINSKSLSSKLKRYSLSLIPNSTLFYNFIFDIQWHLRPQLICFIGNGCLHLIPKKTTTQTTTYPI